MSASTAQPLRGLRLLVVDDDLFASGLMVDLLEDFGCLVFGPVHRLDDALDAIRANEIDGALLDYQLGDQNVFPAAAALALRGTPFILTTGHHTLPDAPALLRTAPILTKPFNIDQLAMLAARVFRPAPAVSDRANEDIAMQDGEDLVRSIRTKDP
jgi:DNA-binding NtrC family response regulator